MARGIHIRADHEPPRNARTRLVLFLLSLFTLPFAKFTFQALFGAFFLLPPCGGGLRWGVSGRRPAPP